MQRQSGFHLLKNHSVHVNKITCHQIPRDEIWIHLTALVNRSINEHQAFGLIFGYLRVHTGSILWYSMLQQACYPFYLPACLHHFTNCTILM